MSKLLKRSPSVAVSEREVGDQIECSRNSFQFYRDDSYSVDFNWEQQPGPTADAKFRAQFGLKFENDVNRNDIVLREA
jgi:hypothetical protein